MEEAHVASARTTYVPPRLHDLGSLVEITKGINFNGPEDGGNKLQTPHHSGVVVP